MKILFVLMKDCFAIILYYLRTGEWVVPDDSLSKKKLRIEKEYFNLVEKVFIEYKQEEIPTGIIEWLGRDMGVSEWKNPIERGISNSTLFSLQHF